jgi:cytochrome c oxidase subunit 1
MSATLTPTPVVTTTQKPQTVGVTRSVSKGNIVVRWLTSTDHKIIGHMYNITAVLYFLLGGIMALIIRAQLFAPGLNVLQTKEQYNQMFTMHGTIMLLLVATPLFAGLANAILPLQLGAPDVAFPRLNMLSFWFYFFGALITDSLPHRVLQALVGSRMHRSQPPRSRPASVRICG